MIKKVFLLYDERDFDSRNPTDLWWGFTQLARPQKLQAKSLTDFYLLLKQR